jgi:hypothetical protein
MISTLARNGNDNQDCEIDLVDGENSDDEGDRNKKTEKKKGTTARKKLRMMEGDGDQTLETDENL